MKRRFFWGMALIVLFSGAASADQAEPAHDTTSDDHPALKDSGDKVDRAIDDAAHATKSAIDSAKEAAIDAIEKARRAVKEALEKAKPHIGSSIEKAKQESSKALDHAKRATEEVLDKARDATDDALESAKQAADSPHSTDSSANPTSAGEATYMTYCALCHGAGARPGVFADALKKSAPDLAEIAKRNGGMFPRARVEAIIRDGGVSGHGTMRLLAWEQYFREDVPPERADQIVEDLVTYLEKHQMP